MCEHEKFAALAAQLFRRFHLGVGGTCRPVGNTAFPLHAGILLGGGLVPAWENYGDRDVGIV